MPWFTCAPILFVFRLDHVKIVVHTHTHIYIYIYWHFSYDQNSNNACLGSFSYHVIIRSVVNMGLIMRRKISCDFHDRLAAAWFRHTNNAGTRSRTACKQFGVLFVFLMTRGSSLVGYASDTTSGECNGTEFDTNLVRLPNSIRTPSFKKMNSKILSAQSQAFRHAPLCEQDSFN